MKKKLKGFTLIELIIVMAIFGIVLAAATSFLQPVQKIVISMDTMNSGNSNVSQISKYLETSLGSAEYIHVAQFVPTDAERQDMVDYFVETYYSGILANGATVASPKYGKAKIHVMVIDNNDYKRNSPGNDGKIDGQISEYVYDCKLKPGEKAVLNTTESRDFAINRAVYDDYSFNIYPGLNKYTKESTYNFNDFLINYNDVYQSSFTIDSYTVKHEGQPNEQRYDFTTTATVPLVNIMKSTRNNGVPVSTYFVVDPATSKIVDKSTLSSTTLLGCTFAGKSGNPNYGNRSTVTSVDDIKKDGMCFIYSFGAEIDTN